MKKGQITLFILLAAVIIALIVAVTYLIKATTMPENDSLLEQYTFSDDNANLRSLVHLCNELVAVQGAYLISRQGGYFQLPALSSTIGGSHVAYGYQRSHSPQDISPSLDQIEQQYSLYISQKLPECVGYFDPYRERGMEVEAQTPTAIVTINPESILIETTYQIKSADKDGTAEISTLPPVYVPMRMGTLYESSRQIVGWVIKDPNLIAAYDLDQLAKSLGRGVTVTYGFSGDTTVYTIRDPYSSILSGTTIKEPSSENYLYEYVIGAKFD